MALVFALRVLVFGLAQAAVLTLFFILDPLRKPEAGALLVLFAIFYLMVGLVLFFIRLSKLWSRLLLLTPLCALLGPTWNWQCLLIWCSGFLVLEAFRWESEIFQVHRLFRGAQLLWALTGAVWLLFPPGANLWSAVGFGTLVWCSVAFGCWRWQEQVKLALESLD